MNGELFQASWSPTGYLTKKHQQPLSEIPASTKGDGNLNYVMIRYADVLLMHAEAALESGNATEALDKLEMIRARARGANNTLLPKITSTDIVELRAKVHQERRIELAMEWERFYDLVRWDEAKSVVPGFIVGKHELFPIPQTEIDKSAGVITQNPGY